MTVCHFRPIISQWSRSISILSRAEKLLRLDDDPEIFATLLTLDYKTSNSEGEVGRVLILLEDILGPGQSSSDRDRNFSLLSYSFNLNPSLRRQIAADMTGIMSEYELLDPSENVHVLVQDSVRHKRSFLEAKGV
jgi:hypothetical protein